MNLWPNGTSTHRHIHTHTGTVTHTHSLTHTQLQLHSGINSLGYAWELPQRAWAAIGCVTEWELCGQQTHTHADRHTHTQALSHTREVNTRTHYVMRINHILLYSRTSQGKTLMNCSVLHDRTNFVELPSHECHKWVHSMNNEPGKMELLNNIEEGGFAQWLFETCWDILQLELAKCWANFMKDIKLFNNYFMILIWIIINLNI